MRERKKPKESWLSKTRKELENPEYYLALRNLELRLIRKQKEKKNYGMERDNP